MKRNWVRNITRGMGLGSALFIFQACYGTPQDFGLDVFIEGQVKSRISGLPIKGIKVSVAGSMQNEITNDEGKFSFYTGMNESLKLQFHDIDSSANGSYAGIDTVLATTSKKMYLDITLDSIK